MDCIGNRIVSSNARRAHRARRCWLGFLSIYSDPYASFSLSAAGHRRPNRPGWGGGGRFSLLDYGDPFPLLVCYLDIHICPSESHSHKDPNLLPFDRDLSLDLVSETSFRKFLILPSEGIRLSFVFHKKLLYEGIFIIQFTSPKNLNNSIEVNSYKYETNERLYSSDLISRDLKLSFEFLSLIPLSQDISELLLLGADIICTCF